MNIQESKYTLGEEDVLSACLKLARTYPAADLSQKLFSTFYNHPHVQKVLSLLQYNFQRPELMFQALTHSTFTHEYTSLKLEHNEKLEFLGDAILDAAISVEIFHQFPSVNEGQLSKLRGSIVNQHRLSSLALFLGLQHCLLLGKGEMRRQREGIGLPSLLANALEALLAAIFLDSGFAVASEKILSLIHLYEEQNDEKILNLEALREFDAKTRLQEITMSKYKTLPQYRPLHHSQDPQPSFVVGLFINGQEILRVEDGSKKRAERHLALLALRQKLYEDIPLQQNELGPQSSEHHQQTQHRQVKQVHQDIQDKEKRI